jgi:hypothetical protein
LPEVEKIAKETVTDASDMYGEQTVCPSEGRHRFKDSFELLEDGMHCEDPVM